MENFDEVALKEVINNLTTKNLIITLASQILEKECDLVEPIYGTKYKIIPFDEEIQNLFEKPDVTKKISKKNLDLPVKNIFLPKNMEIFAKDFDSLPKFP